MSRCLVIFHKQLGDLVLLEPALRCLAHANGHTVDLITRSGFRPLDSLMPHVSFRSKPNAKIYDTLWCFDDRRKSTFYSLLSRARQKHLLAINPGASIQWYHSKIFQTIQAPDLSRSHISEYYWKHTLGDDRNFRPPELRPPPKEWAFRFHLPISCMSTQRPVGEVRIGLQKNGR
jgi:hypothetical protein